MQTGTAIMMTRACFTHSRAIRPLLLCPAPSSSLLLQRPYKFKRSFLSDEEGVSEFISLLGPRERQLLHEGLSQHLRDTAVQEDCETSASPSLAQLRLVFIHQALPFVGFGFLDNLIMILAGEYLDVTIGVTLGISTMAAAGLGNALSDVAGLGSAWYVGKLAAQVGIRHPNLSKAQIEMKSTKIMTHLGRAIGVLVGCILGMCPLLFMHNPRSEKEQDQEKSSVPAKH